MTEANSSHSPKAAFVTGGAIRVGRAFVLALAEAGYDIALHFGGSVGAADATQREVEALGRRCILLQHDLSDTAGLDALVAAAKAELPHLNLLVNSASCYDGGPISEITPEIFDKQFSINLKAPFFLIQAFAKHCQEGCVINILDNKIRFNQFAYSAYLLSKKALAELTAMAAMEFAPNIRVNGIAPGVIMPATDRSPEYIEWRRKAIPLERTGSTDHLAQALLAMVNNDFMTGQIIAVDGGENSAHLGRNYVEREVK